MRHKNYCVFFVDDEPEVCRAVELTLQREEYEVRTFHAGKECFEALAASKCDLLITDANMPGMSGIDLLAQVRNHYPLLPLLAISGYGNVSLAVRAVKAGAVDFLEKPFDREILLEKVKSALEQSVMHRLGQGKNLTKVESKILELMMAGQCSKEIAKMLNRSVRTIEGHRFNIMHKLKANNIVELIKKVSLPKNISKE